MSLTALVSKEVHDLVREKRFGAWALVYAAVWMVISFMFLMDIRQRSMNGSAEGLQNVGEVTYFVSAIALHVLALFVMTDGVARERESGMLPIVAASPVNRAHLLVAKLAASGVAYLIAAVVTLVATGMLILSLGFPVVELVVALFAIPFLALFVYLAGVGLLLGVVCPSSKVALGAAVAVYFPMFFLNPYMPIERMVDSALVKSIIPFTPFHSAQVAASALLRGGYVPWVQLAGTAAIGIVCAAAAFVVFSRQEGAQ